MPTARKAPVRSKADKGGSPLVLVTRHAEAQGSLVDTGPKAPGAALLGVAARTTSEMIETITRGLPTSTLDRLAVSLGLSRSEMLSITGISPRTLARRQQSERLSPAESERVARIARVTERAQAQMGNERGNRWLNGRWPALNSKKPLEYAWTDIGAEAVINLLGALDDGIFV